MDRTDPSQVRVEYFAAGRSLGGECLFMAES